MKKQFEFSNQSSIANQRRDNLKVIGVRMLAVFLVSVMASLNFSVAASAETRSLKLYYIHTKEKEEIVYKKNGKYLSSGLKKINRFLRDWRRNEPTKMDPELLDIVWEAYKATGSREYIHVVSAYRSPATNAMLKKTRGGQATKSQHMLGKAMDFYIPGVPVKKLREIGFKIGGGGVGYYPRSGVPFVHLDTGNVRAWPRMSRSELTRLFPKGGTAHLPTDGKPLPGYQQALARSKSGSRQSTIIDDSKSGQKRSGGLLAALFGGGRDEEEDNEETSTTQVAAAPARPAAAPKVETPGTLLAAVSARDLPVPVSAPRARSEGVAVEISQPAPAPIPQVEVAAVEPAPEVPSFVPPVPTARPAVLIARAEPPIDRQSAQELENALNAANADAGNTIEVAAAPADTNGNDAIERAIKGADTAPEPTTELAYALPIPSAAPARPAAVEVASLPTPEPLAPTPQARPETAVAAYVPPVRGLPTVDQQRPQSAAIPAPQGKSGRVVNDTDQTQTAALTPENVTTPKYARPTAQDTASVAAPKPKIVPADQIDQARFGSWTTTNASLTDSGRAEERPDFIQNATRAVPTVLYTAGFSKAPPPNTGSFSGNAVTFLAVAKFEGGVGEGGDGRGEPLQLSVPN